MVSNYVLDSNRNLSFFWTYKNGSREEPGFRIPDTVIERAAKFGFAQRARLRLPDRQAGQCGPPPDDSEV